MCMYPVGQPFRVWKVDGLSKLQRGSLGSVCTFQHDRFRGVSSMSEPALSRNES